MRFFILFIGMLAIAGCQSSAKKPKPKPPTPAPIASSSPSITRPNSATQDPCAPIHQHDERHYTAGGLYAPHLSDTAPVGAIDISKLVEPTPRIEARARSGNRSPYTVLGKKYWVLPSAENYDERGIASWYGQKFNGRKTSSGEIYSVCEFTAAHKTLPLPSIVRVTHLGNGRSVVVRVNDRGPFHAGRIIDLSYVAAIKLGLDKTGTANVRVQTLNADGSVSNIPTQAAPASAPITSARSSNLSPEPASKSRLQFQFGSFSQRDNAMRLLHRLQAADIRGLEILPAQASESTLWRVLAFANDNEMEAIFEKTRQMGLPKPTVTQQKL